jgi:hypothetical protein
MRAYLIFTVDFALVAVIHLMRFVFGWPGQIGTWTVPLSASVIAVMVSAGFAI